MSSNTPTEVNLENQAPEEALDDLDEEIKMIVARAERRNNSNGSDGLLTFLEEHGLDPALDPNDPNNPVNLVAAAAAGHDLDLDGDDDDQPHLLFVRDELILRHARKQFRFLPGFLTSQIIFARFKLVGIGGT